MNFVVPIFIFLFGLILGSFLNCLVWRLYKEETIGGRSYCPKCKKLIAWYDNIPVLSFMLLRGRCRHCHKPISWQYPIVEFLVGALFVLAFWHYFNWVWPNNLQVFNVWFNANFWLVFLKSLIVIFVMTAVFIYDARWYLISTMLIIVAAVLFLILDLFLGYQLWQMAYSLAIGIAFFGLQFVVTRGQGIGEGDIWLGGLMALIFPEISLLLTAILLSYVIGAIIGVALIAFEKKGLKSKVPLGVFLAFGTIITLFFGQGIVGWYLGFF
jgi:prepilin signal peptidase PulO-like enzyme (type II secretory pathway)